MEPITILALIATVLSILNLAVLGILCGEIIGR